MSKTFFIGDTHFGHNSISKKFRTEFSTDEEHDELIHKNIMKVADKRNHLYLMGDIALKVDEFYRVKSYIENFESVHIVLGNHDHKSFAKFVIEHGGYVHGLIKKWGMWLSHCPINYQERWSTTANVHGHMHDNEIMKEQDGVLIPDPYYINVSCEQINYSPISMEDIKAKVNS
jgi:calcineurin-like phosphoesterase family protein